MHDNIRFWVATLMQIIGLAMIFGVFIHSWLPSSLRMAEKRREAHLKTHKNWSFPGTNDTEESLAKLTPYERHAVLMWMLIIGGAVLSIVGQDMRDALRPPSQ